MKRFVLIILLSAICSFSTVRDEFYGIDTCDNLHEIKMELSNSKTTKSHVKISILNESDTIVTVFGEFLQNSLDHYTFLPEFDFYLSSGEEIYPPRSRSYYDMVIFPFDSIIMESRHEISCGVDLSIFYELDDYFDKLIIVEANIPLFIKKENFPQPVPLKLTSNPILLH